MTWTRWAPSHYSKDFASMLYYKTHCVLPHSLKSKSAGESRRTAALRRRCKDGDETREAWFYSDITVWYGRTRTHCTAQCRIKGTDRRELTWEQGCAMGPYTSCDGEKHVAFYIFTRHRLFSCVTIHMVYLGCGSLVSRLIALVRTH